MKNKLMMSHGEVTHPFIEKNDCMECIDKELKFYKAIKKAGGISNLTKNFLSPKKKGRSK